VVNTSPSNKNRIGSNSSKIGSKATASVVRPQASQPAVKNVPNAKLRAAMAEADEMVRAHRARYDNADDQ